MRKIVLDFCGLKTRKEIHEYLADKMEFPEYYGRNLDALYDCLTDISEPTAIGCRLSFSVLKEEEETGGIAGGQGVKGLEEKEDGSAGEQAERSGGDEYLQKVLRTMMEAETENRNLAVFIGCLEK